MSAWVKEDGVCFGQTKTQEKSNEITAIPELLDTLDIEGGTIHEDDSLIHTGHAPKNLSVTRKIALPFLKKAGSPKVSIRRKQRLASNKRDFLEDVLRLVK